MMADGFFQKNIGELEVTFTLEQEENSATLTIQLLNAEKNIKYKMNIDEEYIQTQDLHFTACIQNVSELYQHLVHEFAQLKFTDNGEIIFEIQVMMKKKVEKKEYRLQCEKYKLSVVEKMKIQMDQLRKQIKCQSERKELLITQLQERQKIVEIEYEKKLQALRIEMKEKVEAESVQRQNNNKQVQKQFHKIKQELHNNSQNISKVKKEMILLIQRNNDKQEQKIRQINQSIHLKNQQYEFKELFRSTAQIGVYIFNKHQTQKIQSVQISNEKRLNQQKGRLKKASLSMHRQIPHKSYFTIIEMPTQNIIKVCRTGQNQIWKHYFGAQELQQNKVHSFQVKLLKTKNRDIMIGIGSKNTLAANQRAYHHRQTLSYYASNGYIYDLGAKCKGGSEVRDGQVITVIVDLRVFTIEWRINEESQIKANICKQMRITPLFFLLQMYQVNDIVQLHY